MACGGRKGATSCSKRQRGKEKEDEPELDGEDGKRHGVVYFQTARSFAGIKVNQDSSMIYLQNMYLRVSRIQFCPFFEIVVAETSIHKTRVVHGTHFSIVEQTEEPVGFGYGRMEDVPRSQIIAL